VVVFPEGTRGHDYRLRHSKRAHSSRIAAGVPVVPIIVHGTIEILRKGSFRVHPGTIDIHLLEPISTNRRGADHRHRCISGRRVIVAHALC